MPQIVVETNGIHSSNSNSDTFPGTSGSLRQNNPVGLIYSGLFI